jgi:hypothetical protein
MKCLRLALFVCLLIPGLSSAQVSPSPSPSPSAALSVLPASDPLMFGNIFSGRCVAQAMVIDINDDYGQVIPPSSTGWFLAPFSGRSPLFKLHYEIKIDSVFKGRQNPIASNGIESQTLWLRSTPTDEIREGIKDLRLASSTQNVDWMAYWSNFSRRPIVIYLNRSLARPGEISGQAVFGDPNQGSYLELDPAKIGILCR